MLQVTRPTHLKIDSQALLHNLQVVKEQAPKQQVIAMVKANAYGCGIDEVVSTLQDHVYAFGVACMEEAKAVRAISKSVECILFQGVFSVAELEEAYHHNLQLVVHQQQQVDWLLQSPCSNKIKVWVKVNTGMHRLGFLEQDVANVMHKLQTCAWITHPIGMLTHLACADEVNSVNNSRQLANFSRITQDYSDSLKSVANSAAILAHPATHMDVVRAGVMLYGVSPFGDKLAKDLGLRPVMHFLSKVTEIHDYPAHAAVGYRATWESAQPSRIGVVPVGYADGYPRCIKAGTKVWVAGNIVPIVGRISMDMLTIDLTSCKKVPIGAEVELWGQHISVDEVALAAGTIGHEIIARIGSRVIRTLLHSS